MAVYGGLATLLMPWASGLGLFLWPRLGLGHALSAGRASYMVLRTIDLCGYKSDETASPHILLINSVTPF